jgi:CRISPR type III-A-associated RAMP protein Csm4
MGKADLIPKDGRPGFTLSSAFPFVEKEGERSHFFPRPKCRFDLNQEDVNTRKTVKKIKWLDQHYFERVIANKQITLPSSLSGSGQYLSTIDRIDKDFIVKDLLQRVAVSRNIDGIEDARPFYMERIFYNNAGLFFMIQDDEQSKVEEALEFLQYEGFGTDRTVGNGFFELQKGEIELEVPTDTELSTNLSLFTPESAQTLEELSDHDSAAYDFVRRGGWITTDGLIGKEKKSVLMFTEGSVWKTRDLTAGLSNINLKPSSVNSHPIWRSGKSLFIPIRTTL